LDRYRDQRLVLIIAPIGDAEPATHTCGVCGFVMNEAGECPRCGMAVGNGTAELDIEDDTPDILDQVKELLDGADADAAPDAGD
jgi:rubredoxin